MPRKPAKAKVPRAVKAWATLFQGKIVAETKEIED